MERLNKTQSKLLKTINKKETIAYTNLTEMQKSACEFLSDKEYVFLSTVTKTDTVSGVFQYWEETVSVSITESGKAYLHNEHVDKYHFSIPDVINIIIALTALAMSAISLLMQLQEIP